MTEKTARIAQVNAVGLGVTTITTSRLDDADHAAPARAARVRRRALSGAFAVRLRMALVAVSALGVALPGQTWAQWAYRTGETRHQQQANFCNSADDVAEIAHLFEKFGARTGFSALSSSPGCALEVHTFTPKSLVDEVAMSLDSGGTYTVRFVHVELADGRVRYVVTTRELHGGP